MMLAGFPVSHLERRARRISLVAAGAAAFVGLFSNMSLAVAAPDSPAGLWFTANDESIIKIAPCGESFCGALIWLKEPDGPDGKPKSDSLNADPAQRGKPHDRPPNPQ